MIRVGNKEITGIYVGNKVITAVYIGTKLVWQAVKSCFGSGKWVSAKPWLGKEKWKNN